MEPAGSRFLAEWIVRVMIAVLAGTLAAGCASIYTDSARQLSSDPRARFDLRVAEARETAAAAERLMSGAAPALPGESWDESVDACRWELDRRVESARDAAGRLAGREAGVDGVLASLDLARNDLAAASAARAGPGAGAAVRAGASLSAAVASADRFLRAARDRVAASRSGGGPEAAASAP